MSSAATWPWGSVNTMLLNLIPTKRSGPETEPWLAGCYDLYYFPVGVQGQRWIGRWDKGCSSCWNSSSSRMTRKAGLLQGTPCKRIITWSLLDSVKELFIKGTALPSYLSFLLTSQKYQLCRLKLSVKLSWISPKIKLYPCSSSCCLTLWVFM